MATRSDGAICATKRVSILSSAFHTCSRGIWVRSRQVGDTAAHWPQLNAVYLARAICWKAGLTTNVGPAMGEVDRADALDIGSVEERVAAENALVLSRSSLASSRLSGAQRRLLSADRGFANARESSRELEGRERSQLGPVLLWLASMSSRFIASIERFLVVFVRSFHSLSAGRIALDVVFSFPIISTGENCRRRSRCSAWCGSRTSGCLS
jgi:hypothetical protein